MNDDLVIRHFRLARYYVFMAAFLTLALMLLLAGLLTAAGVIVIMAISLLRPPRMTDGKALWVFRRLSPADLGLSFEDVSFAIRDEKTGQPMHVAGWWIPHAESDGRCVLMLHGYADAKVGVIAWAPLWNRLGYNILAIDLRAHGESAGAYSTAGYQERHDVNQVIDQFRAQHPAATRSFAVFGVSLGATVAAAVAITRDDLDALVLDSPYVHFPTAIMTHMRRLGAPAQALRKAALHLAERLAGATFGQIALTGELEKSGVPTLIILPEGDPITSEIDRAALVTILENRGMPSINEIWLAPGQHLGTLAEAPEKYQQVVEGFLKRTAEWAGGRADRLKRTDLVETNTNGDGTR